MLEVNYFDIGLGKGARYHAIRVLALLVGDVLIVFSV